MKIFYFLLTALLISASGFGQERHIRLNYDSADTYLFGKPPVRYMNMMSMRYTNEEYQRCVVTFDSLFDVNTMTAFDTFSVSSLLIDSIRFSIGHVNYFGDNDTLVVNLINLSPSGYPGNNILWTESIITNTSLSPGNRWENPIRIAMSPNYLLAQGQKKFGVELKYYGDQMDTCAYFVSYSDRGAMNSCTHNARRSNFYPNSYVARTDSVSKYPLIPHTDGTDITQDCDGDGFRDTTYEGHSFIQDIAIEAFVTLSELPANTVKGRCFIDNNTNNIFDSGDLPYSEVIVSLAGTHRTMLGKPKQGMFTVRTNDTGTVYTSLKNITAYYTVTPVQHTSHFSKLNEIDSVDFALVPVPGKRDVRINMTPIGKHRAGRDITYRIEYTNAGTDIVPAGDVTFVKDHNLPFVSSIPANDYASVDTIRWLFTDFKPSEKRVIDVKLNVPSSAVIGSKPLSLAILKPLTPNENETQNFAYVKDELVGPWDPNDKQSLYGPTITKAQINKGQYLTYLVRFQNVGNDTAFKVVIKDTLDSKLDINTFDLVSSSHACDIGLSATNVMTFTFDNILLVDSGANEPGSQGYISYRMKPKTTLTEGDVIKNTAYIYFDYNLPVATNTTTTTVVSPVLVDEMSVQEPGLWLYPNPAKDKLMLYSSEVISKEPVAISVLNALGEVVQSQKLKWTGEAIVNIKNLPAGIYFLEMKMESGSVVKRFVKE